MRRPYNKNNQTRQEIARLLKRLAKVIKQGKQNEVVELRERLKALNERLAGK